MITEISAVNFRRSLGEMLNQVQYRGDSTSREYLRELLLAGAASESTAPADAGYFDALRRRVRRSRTKQIARRAGR